MNNFSRTSKGFFIAIIGTAIWSATAVFIRYLTTNYQAPPLIVAFWRDTFVSILLFIWFKIFYPGNFSLDRKNTYFIVIYGFVLASFNYLWTVSVALNGAAVSTVLAYSSAAYTAILGRFLFNENINRFKAIIITLSIVGCALVSEAIYPSQWEINPVGLITGLLSGLGFAVYSLFGKSASNRSINPWTNIFYTFTVAAVFLLLFIFISPMFLSTDYTNNIFWFGSHWDAWLLLILLALVPTIGGYGLYNVSLTYLPASVSNLIATMEPIFTAIQASILLGEVYSSIQIIGSLLIIIGVVSLRLQDKSH